MFFLKPNWGLIELILIGLVSAATLFVWMYFGSGFKFVYSGIYENIVYTLRVLSVDSTSSTVDELLNRQGFLSLYQIEQMTNKILLSPLQEGLKK